MPSWFKLGVFVSFIWNLRLCGNPMQRTLGEVKYVNDGFSTRPKNLYLISNPFIKVEHSLHATSGCLAEVAGKKKMTHEGGLRYLCC